MGVPGGESAHDWKRSDHDVLYCRVLRSLKHGPISNMPGSGGGWNGADTVVSSILYALPQSLRDPDRLLQGTQRVSLLTRDSRWFCKIQAGV